MNYFNTVALFNMDVVQTFELKNIQIKLKYILLNTHNNLY